MPRSASWVHPGGLRQKTSKRATRLKSQDVDDAPVLLAMDRKGEGRDRERGEGGRGEKEGGEEGRTGRTRPKTLESEGILGRLEKQPLG